VQALLQMEPSQELIHVLVRFKNGIKAQVFPEFVTIAQFYITKTFAIVMVKGMEVYISVIGKIIRKAIVAAMTIAEKDELVFLAEPNGLGIFIGTVQPG